MSDEIDQKTKIDQNTWFCLKFFSPVHFMHWKLPVHCCVPGDHGTSVSDEIDQKMKVGQNIRFFFLDFSFKLIQTIRS